MRRAVILCGLMLAGCGQQQPVAANQIANADQPAANAAPEVSVVTLKPITMKAADGVIVHGNFYQTPDAKALIVLFHQAGSSKEEYARTAPRLVAAGYSALAIDQRSGGSLYGTNETAAGLGPEKAKALSGDAGFLPAQQDMQAALDLAVTKGLPVILWGSSYSSSLVFPLAAANPGKVKAILSFSPGEYFPDKTLIERAAAKVQIPVFVTSAPTPDETRMAKPIFDALPGTDNTEYVPKAGAHGSSTLIAAKDPQGAEANWRAVLAFVRRVAP